jgi:phosphoserine aminotransferase
MTRAFNFGAGPAMIPTPVMEAIRDEFLDYQGTGCSIIEISHRSDTFIEVIDKAEALFREISGVSNDYKVLFVHGGASLQFSAIPLNLLGLKPARKAQYVRTGVFAKKAEKEAHRYGHIDCLANGEPLDFKTLPEIDESRISEDASYVYMTSNNTIYGTQWKHFPNTGNIPLIIDSTSEILSRRLDYSKFGLIFGGLQKNLGPSGMAVVCIRKDLLGYADAGTPPLLNYETYSQEKSLINTTNTFAIYVVMKVLEWLKAKGGLDAMEKINDAKAKLLYDIIDRSSFYLGVVKNPQHRSTMNVTFNLAKPELEEKFNRLAIEKNLVALEGHRSVGGFRASIYNAMPMEGVQALGQFMQDFEKKEI